MAASDPYQLHFRLPEETGKQVDRYAQYVRETTGIEPTRTNAVLALVRRALVAWDATQTSKKRKS